MHSVTFFWPSFDAEETQFRKFELLDEAFAYGRRQMENMPVAVICLIDRPGLQPIRIWWQDHRLASNLDDIAATEPSLAQKVDWRKLGF
jgi:hypothetical protein